MEKQQYRAMIILDVEADVVDSKDSTKSLVEKILSNEIPSCEFTVENAKGQIVHISVKNRSISLTDMVIVK